MSMKFDIIFLTIALGTNVVCAQDIKLPPNRIPVHQTDAYVWVMVYDGDIKSSKLEDEKTYYWLKAKQIHQSKGGYDGDLLHGEYTALYKNDALKEKGLYVKGLKHGTWKTWHPNGELASITQWKNGIQRGTAEYRNVDGRLIKLEKFKNGQLHGKQFYYADSSEIVKDFKNGREKFKKQKSTSRWKLKRNSSVKENQVKNEVENPKSEVKKDESATSNKNTKRSRKQRRSVNKENKLNKKERENLE